MFLPRKSEPGKQDLLSPSLEILREQVLSLSLFLVDNLVLAGKPVCISPYLLPPVCNHFCSWLSWCWSNTLVNLSILCWCWTPGAWAGRCPSPLGGSPPPPQGNPWTKKGIIGNLAFTCWCQSLRWHWCRARREWLGKRPDSRSPNLPRLSHPLFSPR